MPNIVTKKINIENARTFIESLNTNSLYLFLGKPNPWRNETSPPIPEYGKQAVANYWDEMIGLKRLIPSQITNVVKRVNWSLYDTYDEYTHEDSNLWDKKFYVMNSRYDVYICIDNARRSQSTVEPTGKSLNIFSTSDGYKWKYLYSISISDQLKFLTRNWMPVVKNDTVASVARDGGIENIKIFNGGTNYSFLANVSITGDGTGANVSLRTRLGVIYDYVINNTGTGYRYVNLSIQDSTGQYANLKPILSPYGGHGVDPVFELGAKYVMINSKVEYNEGFGDIPPEISFRRLGIVKNPLQREGYVANSTTLSALKEVTINVASDNFTPGEFVVGLTSGANASVIVSNVVSGNGYIRYVQSDGLTSNFRPFTVGETIIGSVSGETANIVLSIAPEVNHDSGSIIYVENRTPITRSIDQAENLHIVIEF
jgi:hypothetical protein